MRQQLHARITTNTTTTLLAAPSSGHYRVTQVKVFEEDKGTSESIVIRPTTTTTKVIAAGLLDDGVLQADYTSSDKKSKGFRVPDGEGIEAVTDGSGAATIDVWIEYEHITA